MSTSEGDAVKVLCKACKDTGRLDCRVIDGTEGYIVCPFCPTKKEAE